ncbi:MAG TPA: hypothetical protein EYQ21_07005 [Flavobacteriales bacterium]|jgi:hypothetical protein|nr:hypothetical protein [Flavobacteriales bacterium]
MKQLNVSPPHISDATLYDVYPIGTMIINLHEEQITGLVIDWDDDKMHVEVLIDGCICSILAAELTYWKPNKTSAPSFLTGV